MQILKPNSGKEIQYISKNDVLVKITDFGAIFFLKEIIIGPGQHTWEWIPLKEDRPIDLSGMDNKYSTFDHALNRSVNDPYCTIYHFISYSDFFGDYTKNEIKYYDNIKTRYTSVEEG